MHRVNQHFLQVKTVLATWQMERQHSTLKEHSTASAAAALHAVLPGKAAAALQPWHRQHGCTPCIHDERSQTHRYCCRLMRRLLLPLIFSANFLPVMLLLFFKPASRLLLLQLTRCATFHAAAMYLRRLASEAVAILSATHRSHHSRRTDHA
jgi:hypothetical protein